MLEVLKINFASQVQSVSWDGNLHSSFDTKLISAWRMALDQGYFRYKLNLQGSSVIPGYWNFYAELNAERNEQRRRPQEFHSVNEPFNPSLFNFTRIKSEEILFSLEIEKLGQCPHRDLLAINVSPISEGHSLVLPCVDKRYPQVLTQHAIEMGLHLLLMSSSPAFRIAFNSLCGFASVNHLHLHCLYVENSMKLESINLEPLEGPCFQLVNFPSKGFAFQCEPKCESDIAKLSRDIFKLTNFLHGQNEAHNVIMTRGRLSGDEQNLSAIRVFVWVRTPNAGAKDITGFNPAALELFGYFVFKSSEELKNASEANMAKILEDITARPFERYCESVKTLFQS